MHIIIIILNYRIYRLDLINFILKNDQSKQVKNKE